MVMKRKPKKERLQVAERAENKIPQNNQPPAANRHPPALLQQPTQLPLPLPLPPWYHHRYCSSLPNEQLMPPPPQPGYVIPPARSSNPSNPDSQQELQRQIQKLDKLEKGCLPTDLPPGYRLPPLPPLSKPPHVPPDYGQYRIAADNYGSSSFQNFAAPPQTAGSSSTYGSGGSSGRQQETARVKAKTPWTRAAPELLPSYVPAPLPRPSLPQKSDLGREFQRQMQQLKGLDKGCPPIPTADGAGGANYSAGSFSSQPSPADQMESSSTDGGGCSGQVPLPHGLSIGSSSSGASGGEVVNTPPSNLPEDQRILWAAQFAENARLWKIINSLQDKFAISRKEIVECKRRLNSIQRPKSLRRSRWKPHLTPIEEEE